MKFPDELTKQIRDWCQSSDYGLAMIEDKGEGIGIIIFGDSKKYNPDSISVIAAYLLLDGVVTGIFTRVNDNRARREEPNGKETIN